MASEWALEQRKIQPRTDLIPQQIATENKWRRLSNSFAKELRISRKRFVKSVSKGRKH